MRLLLILCLMVSAGNAWALVSPIRKKGRSYESYMQRGRRNGVSTRSEALTEMSSSVADKKPKRNTASRSAVKYVNVDWDLLPEFHGTRDEFDELFRYIRDERFFDDPRLASFKRRIPWLYLDNGCPMRAEWAARKVFQKHPSESFKKVFVFGDLTLNTPYHPDGYLEWWYHVAAGVKFGGVAYVYDPSVDANHPLTVGEWANSLAGSAKSTEIAICNTGTLDPYSLCDEKGSLTPPVALKTLHVLLNLERTRIAELGLNISQTLGEHPPWLTR